MAQFDAPSPFVSASELFRSERRVFNVRRSSRRQTSRHSQWYFCLDRKSYSRIGPLTERLLRTFSEAVIILTRNCSSNLRRLISLNERLLLQFIERRLQRRGRTDFG